MSIFEGLLGYEIIMLIAASIAFAAMLVLVFIQVFRNKSYKLFLYGMGVSFIFMAWPGIAKINFNKDMVEITKYQKEIINKPNDKQAQDSMKILLSKVEGRVVNDPQNILILNNAKASLKKPIKPMQRNNATDLRHP